MGIQAPAEVKFRLIWDAASRDNNLLSITALCQIAGVSRSGYYNWIGNEGTRQLQEEADQKDFALILEAYRFRGFAKGARSIHMRLLHIGIRMNVKKIRRLMKKYGLLCPIRRPNPYRRMAKDMQTNHVAPNVVNREFRLHGARKILLTDITYLFYRGGKCYLSVIMDAYTKEALAWQVSESLAVDFVIETVGRLLQEHGARLDNEVIVHSDQGCHYTSNAFIAKLREAEFVQSMSAKGCCWDNAPQESFFGHMKDEIKAEVAKCRKFPDVQELLEDWMDYYNHDRYQWGLLKLSPAEFYEYLKTGIYPLPKWSKT
ncbi:MAG: IS3 family transposase [Oscillospiraceae bacterium]|nr:IS3 family transposase [Oscillospiraceae bacterium]